MSETEYLIALNIRLDPQGLKSEPYRSFYRSHGLTEESTELLLGNGLQYLRMVSAPPRTFLRLIAEDRLQIGGREFAGDDRRRPFAGAGDALFGRPTTSSSAAIRCWPRSRPTSASRRWTRKATRSAPICGRSRTLKRKLPEDVLVLPGHNLPFVGLRARADELIAHHEARCMAILEACKQGPQTVAELVPVIFGRPIDDPHQLVFAFSEALAHVNILVRSGRLRIAPAAQGLALEAA